MRIDCIVMAGGRATRMGGIAKPLLELCGKPLILWVTRRLESVCRRIIVVYSRATSGIRELCSGALGPVECVEGMGGYVEDLRLALSLVSLPALVTPSDTPFIDHHILLDFIEKALLKPEPVINLVDVERGPVGVTLFKDRGGSWSDVIIKGGYRLLDVDTWDDYEEARRICLDIMGVGLL